MKTSAPEINELTEGYETVFAALPNTAQEALRRMPNHEPDRLNRALEQAREVDPWGFRIKNLEDVGVWLWALKRAGYPICPDSDFTVDEEKGTSDNMALALTAIQNRAREICTRRGVDYCEITLGVYYPDNFSEYETSQTAPSDFLAKFPDAPACENNLDDMACTECGNREEFTISATVWIRIIDNGADDTDGDTNWDESSPCKCSLCDHEATVRDFTIPGLDAEIWQRTPEPDRAPATPQEAAAG